MKLKCIEDQCVPPLGARGKKKKMRFLDVPSSINNKILFGAEGASKGKVVSLMKKLNNSNSGIFQDAA